MAQRHPAAGTAQVLVFYSHNPSASFCEFSNFFWQNWPYEFHFPEFAKKEGFPRTVLCEFSEKAIMVTKAALMGDRATFDQIVASTDPSTVKALGRSVTPFDEKLWEKHLQETAYEVVRQKFESDPALAKVLLSTGDVTIAEATENDIIWGIGINVGDRRVQDPTAWLGRNVLGFALMRTRDHLRATVRGQPRAGKGDRHGNSGGKAKMRWVVKGSAAAGAPEKVVGFYSHQPGERFCQFSNFFWQTRPYEFRLPDFAQRDGFPSVVECEFSEKAIMLTKAALMRDLVTFEKLVVAQDPYAVKALGRSVSNFDNELWTKHLDETAFEVVRQKFESDEELTEVLLSTGDATIAEATSNDEIWGIGLDVGDPRVQDPNLWRGKNVLGTALMRTRAHLRAKREEQARAGAA